MRVRTTLKTPPSPGSFGGFENHDSVYAKSNNPAKSGSFGGFEKHDSVYAKSNNPAKSGSFGGFEKHLTTLPSILFSLLFLLKFAH